VVKVRKGRKGLQVILGQQDLWAIRDFKGELVHKVLKVHKDQLGDKVLKVHRVVKVHKDP
jgi:hypothetical protein